MKSFILRQTNLIVFLTSSFQTSSNNNDLKEAVQKASSSFYDVLNTEFFNQNTKNAQIITKNMCLDSELIIKNYMDSNNIQGNPKDFLVCLYNNILLKFDNDEFQKSKEMIKNNIDVAFNSIIDLLEKLYLKNTGFLFDFDQVIIKDGFKAITKLLIIPELKPSYFQGNPSNYFKLKSEIYILHHILLFLNQLCNDEIEIVEGSENLLMIFEENIKKFVENLNSKKSQLPVVNEFNFDDVDTELDLSCLSLCFYSHDINEILNLIMKDLYLASMTFKNGEEYFYYDSFFDFTVKKMEYHF